MSPAVHPPTPRIYACQNEIETRPMLAQQGRCGWSVSGGLFSGFLVAGPWLDYRASLTRQHSHRAWLLARINNRKITLTAECNRKMRFVIEKAAIRRFVIEIARRHPKNRGSDYPQLWHCWPRWTKRIAWVHRVKMRLCSLSTGHEWSETEIGTNGRGTDHWCRWCDHHVTLPRDESPLPDSLRGLLRDFR